MNSTDTKPSLIITTPCCSTHIPPTSSWPPAELAWEPYALCMHSPVVFQAAKQALHVTTKQPAALHPPPVGRVPGRGKTPSRPGSLKICPPGRLPASLNAPPATRCVQPSGLCPGLQPGLPGGRMPPGKPQPGLKMGGRHEPGRATRHSGSHHLQFKVHVHPVHRVVVGCITTSYSPVFMWEGEAAARQQAQPP
jgi:hypothetical protein